MWTTFSRLSHGSLQLTLNFLRYKVLLCLLVSSLPQIPIVQSRVLPKLCKLLSAQDYPEIQCHTAGTIRNLAAEDQHLVSVKETSFLSLSLSLSLSLPPSLPRSLSVSSCSLSLSPSLSLSLYLSYFSSLFLFFFKSFFS